MKIYMTGSPLAAFLIERILRCKGIETSFDSEAKVERAVRFAEGCGCTKQELDMAVEGVRLAKEELMNGHSEPEVTEHVEPLPRPFA